MLLTLLLPALLGATSPAERLVQDAKALAAAKYPRPTHVERPTPGSFGAAVLKPLAALERPLHAYDSWTAAEKASCRDGADGKLPLPKRCADEAKKHEGAVHALLAATHAAEGGVPPGMQTLAAPKNPLQQTGWMRLQHGARLAAWEISSLVTSGKADLALERCVDLAALGRDAMHGSGALGLMFGVSIEGLALQPCARAIDAAKPARKQAALAQLQKIRAALVPFSATLAQERTYGALLAFGPILPESLRAGLPASAAAIVASSEPPDSPQIEQNLLEHWPDYFTFWDALVASADLPGKERAERFAAARAKLAESPNPLAQLDPPEFAKFGDKRDRAVAVLDLLIEACRVDLGAAAPAAAKPSSVSVQPSPDGKSTRLAATVAGDTFGLTLTPDTAAK